MLEKDIGKIRNFEGNMHLSIIINIKKFNDMKKR